MTAYWLRAVECDGAAAATAAAGRGGVEMGKRASGRTGGQTGGSGLRFGAYSLCLKTTHVTISP